jgi:hypothetical protein
MLFSTFEPADLVAHVRKATRRGPAPRGAAKTRKGNPGKRKATANTDAASTTEATA